MKQRYQCTEQIYILPKVKTKARSQTKPIRKSRKRADRACMLCHSRKVRCDVSVRENHCTNCRLDGVSCQARARAPNSNNRRSLTASKAHSTTATPTELTCIDGPDCSIDERLDVLMDEAESNTPKVANITTKEATPPMDQDNLSTHPDQCPQDDLEEYTNDFLFSSVSTHDTLDSLECSSSPTNSHHQWPLVTEDAPPSEVIFFDYRFITGSNIHRIPKDDFGFLEQQGCLKLPARTLLDTFVQEYFLHVHPILPIINEKDFWELYHSHDTNAPSSQSPISLLLFQAMLFVASPFVSPSTLQALGCSNARTLRATLLRRAKLLYDLGSEVSSLAIAQAAVLLSTASLSLSGEPNTIWLSIAIQNATLVEAHLHRTTTTVSSVKQRNILKRLWWCCIFRDCSISLLLRLPIQIVKEHSDMSHDPLNAQDVRDEFDQSRVYSFSAKLKLAEILSQSSRLFIEIADTLMLLYPPTGRQPSTQHEIDNALLQIDENRFGLKAWRSSVMRDHISQVNSHNSRHDSVALYTNLMYMYYHTARISLCHYQARQLNTATSKFNLVSPSLAKDPLRISEMRVELRDAMKDITECHNQLLRLELIQWLPHFALGFSTLPLTLNLLQVKLSLPVSNSSQQSGDETAQNQLNILLEFMRVYWTRYESVDWITSIIHHVTSFAQLNVSTTTGSVSRNWEEIFAAQPPSYLCLVLMLDLSLSKGRLVQEADLPADLRGLLSNDPNSPTCNVGDQGLSSAGSSSFLHQYLACPSQFDALMCGQTNSNLLGLNECLFNTFDSVNAFDRPTARGCLSQDQEQRSQRSVSNSCISVSEKGGGGRFKTSMGGMGPRDHFVESEYYYGGVESQTKFASESETLGDHAAEDALEALLGHAF